MAETRHNGKEIRESRTQCLRSSNIVLLLLVRIPASCGFCPLRLVPSGPSRGAGTGTELHTQLPSSRDRRQNENRTTNNGGCSCCSSGRSDGWWYRPSLENRATEKSQVSLPFYLTADEKVASSTGACSEASMFLRCL